MSRYINAQHVRRADLPHIPPPEIEVVHDENTRMFKPDVSDLVESFKREGQRQPCLVRPISNDRVQLVAGYRRWMAAMEIWEEQRKAGVEEKDRFKLMCVVVKVSPEKAFLTNLTENFARQELSPTEAAHAIQRARTLFGWVDDEGTKQIASHMHRSVSWVLKTEEILTFAENLQYQIHLNFKTKGEEGMTRAVAEIVAAVPADRQEKVLEEARAASMAGQAHSPGKAPKAKLKAKDVANAAARNTADTGEKTLPRRTLKEWISCLEEYFEDEAELKSYHPFTRQWLSTLIGYWDRKVDEHGFDGMLMRLNDLCIAYWEKFEQDKRNKVGGKKVA